MPESTSPYSSTASTPAFAAPQVVDLLRSQLVSVTEDRRRVMLWSAILATGALMLVGRVESLRWFLSLVPLALLTIWHASLLVRQRRYQAAWDSLLEKAADNTASPSRKAAATASAQASQELGIGSTPAVLGALVAPSVLLFHGLLLGAVVTGGVMQEVEREKRVVAAAAGHGEDSACGCGGGASKVASAGAKSGSGCGCGGGEVSKNKAVRPTTSAPIMTGSPPRNFNSAPARPGQGPPRSVAYPAGPPSAMPGRGTRNPTGMPSAPVPAPGLPVQPPSAVNPNGSPSPGVPLLPKTSTAVEKKDAPQPPPAVPADRPATVVPSASAKPN